MHLYKEIIEIKEYFSLKQIKILICPLFIASNFFQINLIKLSDILINYNFILAMISIIIIKIINVKKAIIYYFLIW